MESLARPVDRTTSVYAAAIAFIRRVAPCVVVLAVAAASTVPVWSAPVRWGADPDSLYYQAKVLSFRGHDERPALHALFAGPKGADLRRADLRRPVAQRQFTNARWIDYSRRFFRRRVFVPLLAAGVYPLFGDRSLLAVSLIGYVLLALALFVLLRRRFGATTSAIVASLCIVSPPVRRHSVVPMTDSWSILLETCALLTVLMFLERGKRWLVPWVALIVAASFTRDVEIVPLAAVLLLALHHRHRIAGATLAVSGAIAVLPALLLFGNASVRENLAYVFSGSNPPSDSSWGFVLGHYFPHLWHLARADLDYGTTSLGWDAPVWYVGLAVATVGLVLLIRRASDRDPFFRLLAYSLVGAAAFVAIFDDYSGLRQEMTFLPAVAGGLALVTTRCAVFFSQRAGTASVD